MKANKHCGINDALGGGVFRCNRPVSPEGNGSYCTYHGKQDARTLKLQLTPKAWMRKWFIYFPRNSWSKIKSMPHEFHYEWSRRNNPICSVKGCSNKSDVHTEINYKSEPVCLDHHGP